MGNSVYDKRVKDIMSCDIVTLHADDTVHQALTLMGENRVSALPVIDGKEHCVGIISTSDLIDVTRDVDQDLRQRDVGGSRSQQMLIDKLVACLGSEKVQSYMSESVTTIGTDTAIGKAARAMVRNRVHHLPVLDRHDRLVGIISTMDILGEFADNAPD